ncbi:DUF2235 domain-containing protein [Pedobacter sp. SYP-B3415]|uniref:phospholipase effector Tle1 domain-containing protein n=1 Tax=Pedobacter sp. SYP-B3415 TaxID=2496641 RepID=UPI001981E6FC|nr:DUF2235 domain-containing protein [Pedobacter sp. SYP-B3415]
MSSVQLGNYTPRQNPVEYIDVSAGMFFDGTKNNKTNTNERRANTAAYRAHGTDPASSYQNDWSNVARLWDTFDKSKSIYIEGIGTQDKQGDATIGYALGSGSTGIRAKVRKGCEKLAQKILPVLQQNRDKKLRYISLDVFGFSRGAAAARNFVYEISKSAYRARLNADPESGSTWYTDSDGHVVKNQSMPACGHLGAKLKEAGINITTAQIRVRFLGIFDTVSSYSTNARIPPNFNDVEELHLNQIGKAQQVIHFTAENEHRENFSLTHTHIGKERSFPGVHSDIGGSYESGIEVIDEIETSWTTNRKLLDYKQKLVNDCWYKEHQLEITPGWYLALKGTRNLRKEYSYIPLQFMAEYGKNGGLPFNLRLINDDKYSIKSHPLLVRVKGYLQPYVMASGRPYVFRPLSANPAERQAQLDLRELRNTYLHWSANRKGIGMDPNSNRQRVYY